MCEGPRCNGCKGQTLEGWLPKGQWCQSPKSKVHSREEAVGSRGSDADISGVSSESSGVKWSEEGGGNGPR